MLWKVKELHYVRVIYYIRITLCSNKLVILGEGRRTQLVASTLDYKSMKGAYYIAGAELFVRANDRGEKFANLVPTTSRLIVFEKTLIVELPNTIGLARMKKTFNYIEYSWKTIKSKS